MGVILKEVSVYNENQINTLSCAECIIFISIVNAVFGKFSTQDITVG